MKTTDDYQTSARNHLTAYKATDLRIQECGSWRGKDYEHILPASARRLNILSHIKDSFWDYAEETGLTEKLHQYFAHLNSSQAMCFNLFFPFLKEAALQAALPRLLGLDIVAGVSNLEFEKTFVNLPWHHGVQEGTNFDCYIELTKGNKLFFELKFTERKFGSAKSDAKHQDKLKLIYAPRLRGLLRAEDSLSNVFFKNYQLFRNISYLSKEGSEHIFFIYPRENDKLSYAEEFLREQVKAEVFHRIHCLALEDLIENILNADVCAVGHLRNHFQLFKHKYLLPRA